MTTHNTFAEQTARAAHAAGEPVYDLTRPDGWLDHQTGAMRLDADAAWRFPDASILRAPERARLIVDHERPAQTIALVACSATKAPGERAAEWLYTSPLFRKARAYALTVTPDWFVLSAKYGILHPRQVVRPYDLTLSQCSRAARSDWARMVRDQLRQARPWPSTSAIMILAGNAYTQDLVPLLARYTMYATHEPLAGLTIGKRLQTLNQLLGDAHAT